MNMLKEKLNQKTLSKIVIRIMRLLFMRWLFPMKPMLGMWTLKHLHTCRIAKSGLKVMRAYHR